MRSFLPIKGPGGRFLTPREKVALLVLGITLVLCLLTLFAGDRAYAGEAGNPVSSLVAMICKAVGGGILAMYGIVLVWSGLIYFKGEKVADVAPLGGRMFAAACVALGVSGALGIAQLQSAGSLGHTIGAALNNTMGPSAGFPLLLVLMMLGVHLASQGAWTAIREPALAGDAATRAPTGSLSGGFGLDLPPPESRFQNGPALPDDGDPTADERTFAVTQAMEEIERQQGVRIVDVESNRPSIGEDVEDAPAPAAGTEEAEVQAGLAEVSEILSVADMPAALPAPSYAKDEYDDGTIDVTPTEVIPSKWVPRAETATDAAGTTEDATKDATEGARASSHEEDEEEVEELISAHPLRAVPAEPAAEAQDSEDDEDHEEDEEEEYVDSAEDAEEDDDEEAEEEEDDDVEDDDVEEDEEYEEEGEDGDEEEEDEEYEDEDDDELEEEADEDELDELDEDGDEEDEEEDEEEEEEDDDEEFEDDEVDDQADEDEEEELDDEDEADEEALDEEQAARPVQAELWAFEDRTDDDQAAATQQDKGGRIHVEPERPAYAAAQADGAGADDSDDPYASGGLLRRLQQAPRTMLPPEEEDRSYTSFDWRGRPLE